MHFDNCPAKMYKHKWPSCETFIKKAKCEDNFVGSTQEIKLSDVHFTILTTHIG